MVDQRTKLAAAASVVLIGIVTALWFRRDPPPPSPPPPGTSENLVLRQRIEPQPEMEDNFSARSNSCDATQSGPAGCQQAGRPITVLTPRIRVMRRPIWPRLIRPTLCRAIRNGAFPWARCCRKRPRRRRICRGTKWLTAIRWRPWPSDTWAARMRLGHLRGEPRRAERSADSAHRGRTEDSSANRRTDECRGIIVGGRPRPGARKVEACLGDRGAVS